MRVLVTGGTGLIGCAIMEIRPGWTYINSNHCDLRNADEFREILKRRGTYDLVVHLAANSGGTFKNQSQCLSMFEDNIRINTNVIQVSREYGIKRLICCLNPCVLSDVGDRIMTEANIHNGEPHTANYSNAYVNRLADIHCKLVNTESAAGYFYQSIIPASVYGPYDQFIHPLEAHVVPALICKAAALAAVEETTMHIHGSGIPIRQFVFSRDLAHIITRIVDDDIRVPRLICAPDPGAEHSIATVAETVGSHFGIKRVIPDDGFPCDIDGQYSRVCSNRLFRQFFPDFKFTSLEDGIRITSAWYKSVIMPLTPPRSVVKIDYKILPLP
jgi:GDP-L-fucose synthase